MNGLEIINDPFKNKGTAFSAEERKQLGLEGLLPPYIQSIEEQVKQTYTQFETKKQL